MQFKKYYTPEQALQKLKHYCAYQERCHDEVKNKLYSLGINKLNSEKILSQLIEENYLNEERFSKSFASGHFKIKHWGRKKIEYELRKKKISDYCIKKALASIDENEYINTIQKLLLKKSKDIQKIINPAEKKQKLTNYLMLKGFEQNLISETIKALL